MPILQGDATIDRMKILIVNTERTDIPVMEQSITEFAEILKGHGIQTETVHLDRDEFRRCISCGKCYKRGLCIYDDEINEISARAGEFDGLAVFAPVYYDQLSERTVAFLERLFRSASVKFVRKAGASFVYARRNSGEEAYHAMNRQYADANMYIVATQYCGSLQEDVREKSIKACAENMAWLIKGLRAAEESNTEKPEYEPVRLMKHMMGR